MKQQCGFEESIQTASMQSPHYILECGACKQYMDIRRDDVVLREPTWYHRPCWNFQR